MRRGMGASGESPMVRIQYIHLFGAMCENISVPNIGYFTAKIRPLQPDYYTRFSEYIKCGAYSTDFKKRFIVYRNINTFTFIREYYGGFQTIANGVNFYNTDYIYPRSRVASSNGKLTICNTLSTTNNSWANMLFYYAQMWQDDNTTLALDLYPVRIGNIGYLFDSVSETLYETNGGYVELGPDIQ